MRVAALSLLLVLSGCGEDSSETYAFAPGEYDPDRVPGLDRLERDAAEGDADAQFQLAFFRHSLTGNDAAALPTYRRLAAEGHVDAIKMLAAAYMHGRGVPRDEAAAARWLARAADRGDAAAARDLESYRAHRLAVGE